MIDGEAQSWAIPNFDPEELTKTAFPKISFQGSRPMALERLQLLRDIHYVNTNNPTFLGLVAAPRWAKASTLPWATTPFHSFDSRDWGPVPEKELIGKALMVLFPLGRTQFIR